MGGVIHAQEDGGGMTGGQVASALVGLIEERTSSALPTAWSLPMRAETPHGTYRFEVTEVMLESGQPAVLRLREVQE